MRISTIKQRVFFYPKEKSKENIKNPYKKSEKSGLKKIMEKI